MRVKRYEHVDPAPSTFAFARGQTNAKLFCLRVACEYHLFEDDTETTNITLDKKKKKFGHSAMNETSKIGKQNIYS